MFKTSEAQYNIWYSQYLGDGDSLDFPSVLQEKPYGPNLLPEKLECVGHLQQRKTSKGKDKLVGKITK